VPEFEQLMAELLPEYEQAQVERLSHPQRERAIGGGATLS